MILGLAGAALVSFLSPTTLAFSSAWQAGREQCSADISVLRRLSSAVSVGRVSYGADGTGDITRLANINHLAASVVASAPNGAALVTADGGMEIAGDWSQQEATHTRLAFCQALASLKMLVRWRG